MPIKFLLLGGGGVRFFLEGGSVEPKVRLQGYSYNPFCSHSSSCLAVLV